MESWRRKYPHLAAASSPEQPSAKGALWNGPKGPPGPQGLPKSYAVPFRNDVQPKGLSPMAHNVLRDTHPAAPPASHIDHRGNARDEQEKKLRWRPCPKCGAPEDGQFRLVCIDYGQRQCPVCAKEERAEKKAELERSAHKLRNVEMMDLASDFLRSKGHSGRRIK